MWFSIWTWTLFSEVCFIFPYKLRQLIVHTYLCCNFNVSLYIYVYAKQFVATVLFCFLLNVNLCIVCILNVLHFSFFIPKTPFFILCLFFALSFRLLRTELHNLRRKGALKTSGSLDHPNIESSQSCARCRIELGKIINRGANCRSCRMRVCKACREFSSHPMDWVCIVCHKQMWVCPHNYVLYKMNVVLFMYTWCNNYIIDVPNYLFLFLFLFVCVLI